MGVFENISESVATVIIFRCHGWRNAYSATRGSGIRIPPTRVAECAFRRHVSRNVVNQTGPDRTDQTGENRTETETVNRTVKTDGSRLVPV